MTGCWYCTVLSQSSARQCQLSNVRRISSLENWSIKLLCHYGCLWIIKFLSTPTTMCMCCCASWHFMQSQSRIQCKEMRSKMVQLFCSTNQFSCVFQCQEQFSRDLCIWISWGGLSFFLICFGNHPIPHNPLYQSISSIYIILIYIYICIYIIYVCIYIYIKHPSIKINHSGCRAWHWSPPPAFFRVAMRCPGRRGCLSWMLCWKRRSAWDRMMNCWDIHGYTTYS